MDAARCRERLGGLMAAENDALDELAVLLDREHVYLVANDIVSLQGATRERQRCVARIMRVDEDRVALCREMGRPNSPQGLEELLRWCDPQRTLVAGWAKCSVAAEQCRKLNDRNGALVGARLQHVQARLGVLIDGSRDAVTYGPRGAYAQAGTGRVLTAEA